jgi:hypothetical protein
MKIIERTSIGNNKIAEIINEEFDIRMDLVVFQYLCEQVGIDKAREITDEQIEQIEGNSFMTKRFSQSLVRCARRIARECNFINDIVPYMVENFGHLTGHITQKRTEEILVNYIDNDLSSADPGYVRETLQDVCGCTEEELRDLGIYYWLGFDIYEEEAME